MDTKRRGFLKAALGLAVAQAFPLPVSKPTFYVGFLDDVARELPWPEYNLTSVTTGRWSSTQPNYQDMSRWDMAFEGRRDAAMFKMDYGKLEMRLLSLQTEGYRQALKALDSDFRLYHYDSATP